jgi:hypothetical protein
MQAVKHYPHNAHNGQNQTTNNQILQTWLDDAEAAIDALFVLKGYLRAWQAHPNLGQLPDDFFMSIVQEMNEAGLMGWLDRPELDELRKTVTGGER